MQGDARSSSTRVIQRAALLVLSLLALPAAWFSDHAKLRADGRPLGTLDLGAAACAGMPTDCDAGTFQVKKDRGGHDLHSACLPEVATQERGRWRAPQVSLATISRTANAQSPYTKLEFKSSNPIWVTFGIWSQASRSLLLLDTPSKTILNVALEEELVTRVSAFNSRTGTQLHPWRLQADGNGYLLQSQQGNDGSLLVLDNNFAVLRRIRYQDEGRPEVGYIGAMNQWVPTGDGEVVAIGATSMPDPNNRENKLWSSAVIRFPYDRPGDFTSIDACYENCSTRELARLDSAKELARLGNPILAVVGGAAFALLNDEERPGIFKVGKTRNDLGRIKAFPQGYGLAPRLIYNKDDPDSLPAYYRGLESMQIAVGLYSQGSYLYLLTRQPSVSGDLTSWILHRIDPRTEQTVGHVLLESDAPHISLIPGKDEWAIIEKGRVGKLFEQPINAITRVPAAWIEERSGGAKMADNGRDGARRTLRLAS